MEAWIYITIGAAAAQTGRFMVQKRLTAIGFSATGATWARFLYSAPLVAMLASAYAIGQGHARPALGVGFWPYAMAGGAAQILATVCVVAIFAHRNFAVGLTFKKTEVLLTAGLGYLVLGDAVSVWGGLALAIGFLGLYFLSDPPGGGSVLNRAAGLGILSGIFFAISAVGYRGAVLAVEGGDTALRAGLALAIVTSVQTLVLGTWLLWRAPEQVRLVLSHWRVAGLVGILSMLGSFGWFVAFSLQNAAYVFAVGQIELIFAAGASVLVFGERIARRESSGMALIAASIVLLVTLG
ncbi:MAG: DMT family transporter [Pseudomonadota bacterium]